MKTANCDCSSHNERGGGWWNSMDGGDNDKKRENGRKVE